MNPFVPMDNYTSQRDSMAFVEWFLTDPQKAIYALDGQSLKWKLLPDLVTPDGETSVAVRHIVYQCVQLSSLDQSFITSFGFSYGKKDEISKMAHHMKLLRSLDKMDPLEQVIVTRHYEPNLYDPQEPFIVSETYKSLYHFAKPMTAIAFADKESVNQLINDAPVFHKKMELLERTIKVLDELEFSTLFNRDIFEEFENIRSTEFILPSVISKGLWCVDEIQGILKTLKGVTDANMVDIYIGKTIEEQDTSADFIKTCLIKAKLFYNGENSFKEFEPLSKFQSLFRDNEVSFDKNIGTLMMCPLLGKPLRSTKLNDSLLLLNTIDFLRGTIHESTFSEIIERTSLYSPKRQGDLVSFGKMIDDFIVGKMEFDRDQLILSDDARRELLQKRETTMLGIVDKVIAKRNLVDIQHKLSSKTDVKPKQASRKVLKS